MTSTSKSDLELAHEEMDSGQTMQTHRKSAQLRGKLSLHDAVTLGKGRFSCNEKLERQAV